MKPTPHENHIQRFFKPGQISKDGFLGKDMRHVHDIIQADMRKLTELHISPDQIADSLQNFIQKVKSGLESEVDLDAYRVKVQWSRGVLSCPFGEKGMHSKIIATVQKKETGESIRYSQLNVHMIREHGFFEGKGSTFRLEPEVLIKFLNLKNQSGRKNS